MAEENKKLELERYQKLIEVLVKTIMGNLNMGVINPKELEDDLRSIKTGRYRSVKSFHMIGLDCKELESYEKDASLIMDLETDIKMADMRGLIHAGDHDCPCPVDKCNGDNCTLTQIILRNGATIYLGRVPE